MPIAGLVYELVADHLAERPPPPVHRVKVHVSDPQQGGRIVRDFATEGEAKAFILGNNTTLTKGVTEQPALRDDATAEERSAFEAGLAA